LRQLNLRQVTFASASVSLTFVLFWFAKNVLEEIRKLRASVKTLKQKE